MNKRFIPINDVPGFSSHSEENLLNRKIYNIWMSMFKRLNNIDNVKNKCYADCSICEDWLYLSKFIEDFKCLPGYDNFIKFKGEGFCLDKDIIVPGNKVYSKDTCCLVTLKENTIDRNHRNHIGKKVKGTSIKDGSVVIFNTMREAEKKGFKHGAISKCCRGIKHSHKGYVWEVINL